MKNRNTSDLKTQVAIGRDEPGINTTLPEENKLTYQSVEDTVVNELNMRHATVHTDQFYILTEKENETFGGRDFTLESKQSFRSQYENKLVECSDGKMRSKAEIWLKSPRRKEYQGINFNPSKNVPGFYNLWKGFSKEPKKGDCKKYWDHVRENVCDSNEEAYQYVRKWLAYVFQHPDRVHTALVLCGTQGVGKNSFVEPLGKLLGQHYVFLSNITELITHFNFHLKNAVLIFANEALWGGNKKDIGTLKAMITDSNCLIEGKGKDRIMVKNFKHVIVCSNEDWPVHLDHDDRRFYVLHVSEKRKNDGNYFAAIEKELNDGGLEALLDDLLSEDLKGYNPREFPKSAKAFDIKLLSASSVHQYLFEVLKAKSFDVGQATPTTNWGNLSTGSAYMDYATWCNKNGIKQLCEGIFGKQLLKAIPSIKKVRPREDGLRLQKYELPSIENARKEFETFFKAESTIWEE